MENLIDKLKKSGTKVIGIGPGDTRTFNVGSDMKLHEDGGDPSSDEIVRTVPLTVLGLNFKQVCYLNSVDVQSVEKFIEMCKIPDELKKFKKELNMKAKEINSKINLGKLFLGL